MSVWEQIVQERDALKAQLDALRRELREIVAEAYGEHILEDMQDDEDVIAAIENLNYIIDAQDKEIARHEGELDRYKKMFPCCVCGKPMEWKPDDPLGQTLQKFVREGRWGHTSCVNTPKR